MAADVLADPVDVVVDLISNGEPGLDRGAVTALVESIAAGRVKRRRLAQALLDKPSLLTDGRSPAPRVVGDLLIALRRAGASGIPAPVCADCGKALRSLTRRGDNWYCGGCGPAPERCTVCGLARPVARRDRHRRPHCVGCRPADEDDLDLTRVLLDAVTAVDPVIDSRTVIDAIHKAAPAAGQRRRLAWAVQDNPGLLTGDGAHAPVPALLRLIDLLCEAGAAGVIRPPCPHCGRVIALIKPRDGVRLCRNCVAKSRTETCFGCGAIREPACRDEQGRPLCPRCLIGNPANQEVCLACRRRRPVSVRTADGAICAACRPSKTVVCTICSRTAHGGISRLTGTPWCHACQQRRAPCTRCGNIAPVRGGTIQEPLCAPCTRPDASWYSCPDCGQQSQIRQRRCAHCSLGQRLTDLLSDDTGHVRSELRALHENLVNSDRPDTVLSWLNATSTILATLTVGQVPLTHTDLDELPASKPVEHLRSVLVATAVLPARDEEMVRLERWITEAITGRDEPAQQQQLRRYVLWHLLRRLRSRNAGAPVTHAQAVYVQSRAKAAIRLLDWLTARRLSLTTATQGDLDIWFGSDQASYRNEAGHFVRWANRNRITALDLAAVKWEGPTRTIDTEARWAQIRLLLHDDTKNAADRVAGLLILLYAQSATKVSRLTLDHIEATGSDVRIRFGGEPIVLPEPLDSLVLTLIGSRRGHAVLGDQGTSPWLFPGGRPGQPISPYQLSVRLRRLGLRVGEARSAALFQLATDLPAALLARLLGINISVAVNWQRVSSGDWTGYAADYSRRQLGSTGLGAAPSNDPR